MVPENWQLTKIGFISETVTSGSRDWAQYYSDKGKKFVRMTNLKRDSIHLNLDDLKYVDVKSLSSDGKRTSLKQGDILISITAELGKIGLVPKDFGEAYINQHLALVRLKEKIVNTVFVAYVLASKHMNHVINRLNDSGAKAGLNLPTIKSVPILLPPIDEQKKIAEILSTWDRAIETTEKLIENSKAQKKALIQQLLTGKRRFFGCSENWQTTKLRNLCSVKRGASPRPISSEKWFADTGRGWVRISDVTRSSTELLEKTEQYLSNEGVSNSVSVEPGELIMSICATIGVPKFLGIPACIHDGFVVFKNVSDNLYPQFLFYVLEEVTERLAQNGQPGTQKNINTSIVGNIDVPKISVDEQKAISLTLLNADKNIRLAKEKYRKLITEKSALMQQLLTGKRRVKLKKEELADA